MLNLNGIIAMMNNDGECIGNQLIPSVDLTEVGKNSGGINPEILIPCYLKTYSGRHTYYLTQIGTRYLNCFCVIYESTNGNFNN